ncbi:MAG: GAF domain-containing protein [Anaerolineaceae bacterium]|nr:GAF domain-containing protein [Anaerolineaceae bacterium]
MAKRPKSAPQPEGNDTPAIASLQQMIKELEEQRAFFRQVIDMNPNLIFVKDREGRFVLANEALARIYGTTTEDVVGRTDADFAPEEQAKQFHLDDLEIIDSLQETLIPDRPLTDSEGNIHWMQATKRPIIDPDGVARRVLGVSVDVTERKRMEESIRQSLAQRVRQVETGTEIAQEIAMAPALDELYRRVVTLVKERLGYYHVQIFRHDKSAGSMVVVEGFGQPGHKMKAAQHRLPYGRGVVGTAAATGKPVLATDVRQDPNWLPHPDLPDTCGELAVPIKMRDEVLGVLDVQSDRPGALGEEDEVLLVGLAGQIAIAIEGTRLAEETQATMAELQQSQRFLDTLLHNLPNPVFVKDSSGVYIECNQAYLDFLGRTKDEVLGKTVYDVFDDAELVDKYHAMDEALLANPGVQTYDATLRHADGTMHEVIFNKATFADADGSLRGLIGVVQDITERKQVGMRIEAEVEERTRQAVHAQEELRRVNRALTVLSRCNQAAMRAKSEDELLNAVCQIVVDAGQYIMAWIASVEHDEAKSIHPLARAGADDGYLETIKLTWADAPMGSDASLGRGPVGKSIRSRQPTIVRNTSQDADLGPWGHEARKRGFNSIIALPLLSEGEPFAALTIYAREIDAFDAREVELLVDLANSLSYGVLALRSRRETERLQQEILEAQQRAIQELSTPVIPIMDRILVMPLIGSIDSLRAKDIMRVLLAGISRHRARVVILDITGVPLVDSGVANHLNKTIQAARLKGARTIITGVSDAVAETVVDLGIDWSGIETLSDLQTGLIAALQGLGVRLAPVAA